MLLTVDEFNKIANFVTNKYGIKLPIGKKVMVESRLSERVEKLKFEGFTPYVEYIFSRKGKFELSELIEHISTNETWFFREPEHFKYITTYLRKKDITKKIRVWSSACSSGEEAYSIAMTLEELKETEVPGLDYKIWCTDISNEILQKASMGIYSKGHLENLKKRHIDKYLDLKNSDKPRITYDLRSKLIFKQFNLIDEKEYQSIVHKFDIIFCRNVLIYFNRDHQEKVITHLASKLKIGGLFMIGHTETSIFKKIESLKMIRPALYERVK
ncbi:MAG: hypothetical protein OEW75_18550 [Cyclobacteriaceae bacterium]|nr:hypothetical protein [Cyclobacteriaceae bacterium]